MVLSYGLYKLDPVIILGQVGILVYARNVYWLLTGTRADAPPELAQTHQNEGVHGAASKKIADMR